MTRIVLFCVGLLCSGGAWSNDSPLHQTIKQHNQATEHNKTTPSSPASLIKNNETEVRNDHPQQSDTDAQNKLDTDRELAEYTRQLALFTAALVFATVLLGIIGVWQGWLTREVVGLAREEFVASHRPKIILRNVSVIEEDGIEKILYSLINIGESKATIVNSWILGEFIMKGDAIRNMRCAGHDDLGNVELAPGEDRDFIYVVPTDAGSSLYMRLGRDAIRMTLYKDADFYFAGSIRYADDLGNIRTSVFRRKFDNGGFYKTDNPDHEYAD